MSDFDDADLGSSPDYLWRDANGRRFGLWAQLRVVEEWTRILRYCEYDDAAGQVHMVTPFAGPDGDLLDYYALKSAAGGWHLMYDYSGPESAAAAALAKGMGCRLEMGVLRADIRDVATEGEATAILLDFLSAAVALAVAGDLLPADDEAAAATPADGEWLTADFEDGTIIEVRFA